MTADGFVQTVTPKYNIGELKSMGQEAAHAALAQMAKMPRPTCFGSSWQADYALPLPLILTLA